MATARPEPGPLERQRGVGDRPPVVLVADHGVGGRAGIGHEDLVEQRPPGHLLERTNVHPRLMHVDREVADALVLGGLRVGAGDQHPEVGVVAAGGPHLLAVDDPLVAVLDGPSLEPRQVAARRRLAEQLAPGLLARHDVAHVQVDLLLGAVGGDRGSRQQQSESTWCSECAVLADRLGDLDGIVAGEPLAVGVLRERRG